MIFVEQHLDFHMTNMFGTHMHWDMNCKEKIFKQR